MTVLYRKTCYNEGSYNEVDLYMYSPRNDIKSDEYHFVKSVF